MSIGMSSEDLGDSVVDEVVAIFAEMDKEERQELLSELLSRYCPECGDGHASCACEIDESIGPETSINANDGDEVDLDNAELEEGEEEIDGSLDGLEG